jgi:hypothetical protein
MLLGVASPLNHQNTRRIVIYIKVKKSVMYLETKQYVIFTFPNRIWIISTPWLNTLLCVHLVPINLIVSQGPNDS